METLGAGKVEISFINRNHFDDGREFREDRRHAIAPLRIFCVVAIQINGVRTKPPSGAKRHGGMHAKLASFVASSRDDAALIRLPADDHRFAAQLRPLQQFHGDKERVHVDVQDRCDARQCLLVERAMNRAEASQFRHAPSLRFSLFIRYVALLAFSSDYAGDAG